MPAVIVHIASLFFKENVDFTKFVNKGEIYLVGFTLIITIYGEVIL